MINVQMFEAARLEQRRNWPRSSPRAPAARSAARRRVQIDHRHQKENWAEAGKLFRLRTAMTLDAEQFVRDYESGTAPHRRLRLRPAQEHRRLRRRPGRARSTASRAREVVEAAHRCAEGGVAPRRGRRRRQDRRRRRHPCRSPAGLLRRRMCAASGHEPRAGRLAVGMVFLPRTDLGAQEAAAPSSRPRSCASATPSTAGARCRSTSR